MSKSRDAFRTISEVSGALDVPAHVLRFWESKFAQVKPVKRAGGRRYYRPADVDLLAGIKKLLHEDGLTIKGAQKLIREQGVKSVSAMGAGLLSDAPQDVTPSTADALGPAPTPPEATVNITNVVPLAPKPEGPAVTLNLAPKSSEDTDVPDAAPAATDTAEAPVDAATAPDDPAPSGPDTADIPVSAAAPSLPDDPSDSDSKAPARLFHLLRDAPAARLAAQAGAIAPLLDRMRILRGRIETR